MPPDLVPAPPLAPVGPTPQQQHDAAVTALEGYAATLQTYFIPSISGTQLQGATEICKDLLTSIMATEREADDWATVCDAATVLKLTARQAWLVMNPDGPGFDGVRGLSLMRIGITDFTQVLHEVLHPEMHGSGHANYEPRPRGTQIAETCAAGPQIGHGDGTHGNSVPFQV